MHWLTPPGRRCRGLLAASILVMAACVSTSVAAPPEQGAPPPATGQPAPSVTEQIETRRQENAAELERVTAQLAAAGDAPSEQLVREKGLLERIDALLNQQLGSQDQKDESDAALEELKGQLAQWQQSGPAERGPYSLILLDSIRDELLTLRSRIETIEAGVTAAGQARDLAQAAFEDRETARRQAREASETNKDEAVAPALARALRIAVLESRQAEEELGLRKIESERQQVLKALFETRIGFAEEQEKWIAADATLSMDDYRGKIVELEAKEEQLRRRLSLQQSQIDFAEREWFEAKRRLDAGAADRGLVEEVAARRLALQLRQRELAILTKRAERVASMQTTWKRRLELWRKEAERPTIAEWDADARAALEALDTEYRLQELELRDISKERVTLQNRLEGVVAEDSVSSYWLQKQVELTNEIAEIYEANVASIDSARRLTVRMLGDIGGELAVVGWSQRLDRLRESIVATWQFEITSVDDRSITVGKVIVGIFLLFLGFFLSKVISTILGRSLLPRFGLNEGAAAAIRSIAFYILLVTFVFIALRTINVPLTAFTILGGAVAIGIGFGSQNIMNNFMSGLILLAERPIRVGDLIQLGDLYGIVQHLGARSTRVITGENVEIVVPNSAFLESNVINWTLTDSKVRIFVKVGVSYGSPTRDVSKLLLRAAQEHGRVLKSPAPIVLFTEFGDNSLNFEVHFWITMRKMMDRRILESDIHHRIDALFREAGIVIAFPQRDVHLDLEGPLDVRVMADETAVRAS